MAGNKNMTFSVSLKLLTKSFQTGIKSIQTSLGRLRQQFSTFVGGIGIGLGFKELIDNAKQLDKAQATLKNVSKGVEGYRENLSFVQELSKKYNQDLIVLMGSFSKFYAASKDANMALEDQYYIYESLTRAAAFYNLTADETNSVMLAVEQMISKGRVSTEELRRQLGERLPGAMNLAAKAMGVTVEELDRMIKSGDVAAKELLPLLASELNMLTSNLDVNTLQGFTNKLRNAFTGLVENLDVKGVYKKFLNAASGGIEYLSNNLSKVGRNLTVVLSTIMGKKAIDAGRNAWKSFFDDIQKSANDSIAMLNQYKKALDNLTTKKSITVDTGANGALSIDPAKNTGVASKDLDKAVKLTEKYNQELVTSNGLQDKLNHKWKTVGGAIGSAIGKALKFAAVQAMWTAISAAISIVIAKTIEWVRKLNEVKRKTKDIKKELEMDLNTVSPEQSTAESLLLKGNETLEKRRLLIRQINDLLGRREELAFTEKNTDEEINAALKERISHLDAINKLQSKQNALSEMQTLWNNQAGENTTVEDLKKEKAELQKKIEADKPNPNMNPQAYSYAISAWSAGHIKDNARLSKINQLLDLAEQIEQLKGEVNEILTSNEYLKNGNGETGTPTPNTLSKEVLEEYEKIQKEHNNKLRALNDRLNDNTISQQDYDKAVKDLYFSTLENIYALNDINENTDPFAKSIKDAVKAYLSEVEAIRKTEEAIKEYNTKVQEAKNQFANGVITQAQLDEKLFELLQEVVLTISAFGNLNETAQELADSYAEAKKVESNRKANEIGSVDFLPPQAKSRDTSFDYKKTAAEIAGENAELWRDEIKNLEELIKKYEELQKKEPTAKIQSYLDELNKKLQTATAEAETFEQAMKLATAQEDIKSLRKELRRGVWGNVKNIASSTDRLVKSFEEVSEVMNDPEASEWEKIIAHFNAFAQIVDTFGSIVQLFQQLNTVTEQLSAAQQGYQAIQEAGTAKTLMNAGSTIIAKEGEALAGGTASAAGLPFPANLIAIASIVGMIASIFASLPKFASGGIVGGNSPHGDKILARLNSGEVVLNKMQQASLWGMLNGKGGVGGNVEFKIRGADLVGTINNYSKKISK